MINTFFKDYFFLALKLLNLKLSLFLKQFFKPILCSSLKAKVLFFNSNTVGIKKMRLYISGNNITLKNAPAAVPISSSCTVYQRLIISRLSPKFLCICSLKLASFCGVLRGRGRRCGGRLGGWRVIFIVKY